MRIFGVTGLTGLLGFAFCVSAIASPIDPTFTTFGKLNNATFGGTGIPNTSVAVTKVTSGGHNFTLGLTAHQRYSNPVLENDGAGTFWAVSGGDTANHEPSYARWNVGYYVNVNPGLCVFDLRYSVRIYYDKNPAIDNNVTAYRTLWDSQNSDNLGYGFSIFGIPLSGFPGGTFDPNATGEYSFALVLMEGCKEIGRSAINVNVNKDGKRPLAAVPDGGSSLVLLGIALAGLGSITRFRK
jgi:hypothetical protein